MALIIGITGSIATGKSSACRLMAADGARHLDADRLVHTLYEPGKPAFGRIVAAFGDEVVGPDGHIDRKILGSRVFGKPDEMTKLTTAIGNIADAVKQALGEWEVKLGDNDVLALEAVNLIEAGYGRWCNAVWLFASDDDAARQRLMQRNGLSAAEAEQRLASQRDWQERAPAADKVFHNDGDMAELDAQVRAAYDEAVRLSTSGRLPMSKYYGWWERRSSGATS